MKEISLAVFLSIFSPFYFIHSAPPVKQEVVEQLKSKLNSDRIAYFFGSYGVESIQVAQSPFKESRITNLYSVHNDEKIMRTLAVVNFKQPIPESLKQVHADVRQGQSIGIALRENGWTIEKMPLYFGSISLSPQLQAWMHEESSNRAAVHIYELNVFKEDSQEISHYCTIIEIHSPQYLDENWLRSLYFDQYSDHREASCEVDLLIDSLHSLLNEFPLGTIPK